MDNTPGHGTPHKANGKAALPADWKAQRATAAATARSAPRINAGFLKGMERSLGVGKPELAKLLNISDVSLYKYLNTKICPDYIFERANAVLAAKGLPPIGKAHPPRKNAGLKIEPKGFKPPKGTVSPQVPSGFLHGIEEKLGIPNVELLALLGTDTGRFYTWKKKGTCPLWVRSAISGLLAEKGLNDGTLTDATVKVRKPGSGRKPGSKNAIVPVTSNFGAPQIDAYTDNNNQVILMVAVPRDRLPVVSALLASFGFPIKQQG